MGTEKKLIATLASIVIIAALSGGCQKKRQPYECADDKGTHYHVQCASMVPKCDRKTAIEIDLKYKDLKTDTFYLCCAWVPEIIDSLRVYYEIAKLPWDNPGPSHVKTFVYADDSSFNIGVFYFDGELPNISCVGFDKSYGISSDFGYLFFKDEKQFEEFISQVEEIFKTCCLE